MNLNWIRGFFKQNFQHSLNLVKLKNNFWVISRKKAPVKSKVASCLKSSYSNVEKLHCYLINDFFQFMNHPLIAILFRQTQCLHMFFKIGLPKNFAMFTGKHLCWSLFLPWLFLWNSSGRYFCSENVRKILGKAFANQQYICKLTGFKLAASQKPLSVIHVS